MHGCTAETPLDRSPTATIARAGGRLVAVLLPLAAIGVIRAFPTLQVQPSPWLAPGASAAAAVIAGLALLVAVAAALEDGRIRDLADLAGLGMLAAALAVLAFGAAGSPGLGIGVVSAAAAFVIGTSARGLSLAAPAGRVAAMAVALVLVEASLGAVLAAGGWSVAEVGQILLAVGAALLAGTAVASLDEPGRATALGIAASSCFAVAMGGGSGIETVIGIAGLGVAAAAMGWRLLLGRLQRAPAIEPIAELPALPAAAEPEPSPE